MAILGQVMVPLLLGRRMVPSRANLVFAHRHRETMLSRATSTRKLHETMHFERSAESPVRSCGHMMLPKLAVPANVWSKSSGRCTQILGLTHSLDMDSANSWSRARPPDGPCDTWLLVSLFNVKFFYEFVFNARERLIGGKGLGMRFEFRPADDVLGSI